MQTIGIIGSGTMGSGIAEVAALNGYEVILHDVSADALANALARVTSDLQRSVSKGRISQDDAVQAGERFHPRESFADLAGVELVIEAALESLDVKREIFQKLDEIMPGDVILATNTSSLSITAIGAMTRRPERVVGMHFFNPPPVMKLVEIVQGKHTSQRTIQVALDVASSMGKTPVLCKDTPGFIVNRVARPFYGEALRLLGEGVASVEEIDRIVRAEGGFRMGPFELMDLIGIDVNYAVTQSVYEQFFHEPRFRPHPIQRQMVDAGTLGRKTRRGFYSYDT